MNDLLILIPVFLAAWSLTGVICAYAEKISLLDVPNARSSHESPTPRGGGLAIVLAFVAVLLFYLASGRTGPDNSVFLLGAILLVAAIGLLDDFRGVPARWRLLTHFGAAVLFVFPYGGELVRQAWYPGLGCWAAILVGTLIVFSLVWLLNLYNFMDGIDGIAAAEAIFIAASGAVLAYFAGLHAHVLIFLTLAAACLGFSCWNWPPAKIFLGDVGSGFLGFTLGALAVQTVLLAPGLTIWPWLILGGVFLVDATYTLLIRMIRGERWYQAHRSHAYQHAALRLKSHRRVTLYVLLIDVVWLLPLAALALANPHYGPYFTLLAYLPLVMITRALQAGENL